MYNVLLVDDEELLRRALSVLIPWEGIDCQMVGGAANGEEALKFISNYPVDIVITDIRMPLMDGTALMERIYNQFNHIKIIVLSGYDEFQYVKAALQHGACNYVLKPVVKEEIVEAISKAKFLLKNERELTRIRNNYLNHERQLFLQKVVKGKVIFSAESSEQFQKLGIDLSEEYFCVGVAEIRKNNNNFDIQENDGIENFRNNLVYLLDAKSSLCEEVFFLNDSRICMFVADNDNGFDPESVFINIRKIIFESFGFNCVFGIGSICRRDWLGQSFSQAVEALKFSINYPSDSIINYEKIKKIQDSKLPPNYPFHEERELLAELTSGNEATIISAFERFYLKIFGNSVVTEDVVQQMLTELIVSIKRFLIGYSVEKIFDGCTILEAMSGNMGLEGVKSLLLSGIIDTNKLLVKYKKSTGRGVVERVKEFIEQNYAQKITLEQVTEMVFVSKSYFCKIFKDETGQSFKNYTNNVRIVKAKELLKDCKYKNYEISYLVGFEDPGYFNQLFKRKTGVTPLEYRNM